MGSLKSVQDVHMK